MQDLIDNLELSEDFNTKYDKIYEICLNDEDIQLKTALLSKISACIVKDDFSPEIFRTLKILLRDKHGNDEFLDDAILSKKLKDLVSRSSMPDGLLQFLCNYLFYKEGQGIRIFVADEEIQNLFIQKLTDKNDGFYASRCLFHLLAFDSTYLKASDLDLICQLTENAAFQIDTRLEAMKIISLVLASRGISPFSRDRLEEFLLTVACSQIDALFSLAIQCLCSIKYYTKDKYFFLASVKKSTTMAKNQCDDTVAVHFMYYRMCLEADCQLQLSCIKDILPPKIFVNPAIEGNAAVIDEDPRSTFSNIIIGTTNTMLKRNLEDFLFVLLGKSKKRFVSYFGYGVSAGLLYRLNSGDFSQEGDLSSDDELFEDAPQAMTQDGLESIEANTGDMTEEEKEAELDRLFGLFARLDQTGIIKQMQFK